MMIFYVQAPNERPDCRLVKAFLWGDTRNVDADGNSHNPASRAWTELMFDPRDTHGQRFDIVAHQSEPLILKVMADNPTLAAQVAYFLGHTTDGAVARHPDGPYLPPSAIGGQLGADFNLAAGLERVEQSPFTRATLANPYPNLH
ncbi:MAG: hypothetical protein H0T53_07105 [Herpetosiphonaceae bacterium]|nr:hypothetical protein [Herpetosiphonaceae bacterium]